MEILHIIRGLANSSGTTHIVVPLAEAQARLGHRVVVFFVRKGDRPAVVPDEALVESACFDETISTEHIGFSMDFARTLSRRIREFDVVHVHAVWNFTTWWAMRVATRNGVPCMVAPQGSLEPWAFRYGHPLRRLYARFAEMPLLSRVTRLQALSRTEAAQFRAFGLSTTAATIPNGVAEDWLDDEAIAGSIDRGRSGEDRTILFLSRLHPKKGVDILLRAFARLDRDANGLGLHIAGDDAGSGYGRAMRELAVELGIDERVTFLGEVQGTKKRKILQAADLYVLPSHSEGLPVAVLEAMACGLPVLITPGCNLPEVAERDAGLIVEPAPDAVARGIRSLLSEGEGLKQRGERGRALVREKFTWPRIADEAIAAYHGMIAETRAGAVST